MDILKGFYRQSKQIVTISFKKKKIPKVDLAHKIVVFFNVMLTSNTYELNIEIWHDKTVAYYLHTLKI